jgi:wyosine [tRNA(Phe)-imidazoG37] synthetase (radical SAM superfamily)
MIAFGPVPSRRLGRSLGVNNIPPKVCSYACVYCQLGRAIKMQTGRQVFYQPEEIFREVKDKVSRARSVGESIDYITMVPDGEPCLDSNLEKEIALLRELKIRIAVITNASLIWREDVRQALMLADWVSLKVDAVQEEIWRRVDRPHKNLHFDAILDGMRMFAHAYQGELVTETMLVKGRNDETGHVRDLADFLVDLKPVVAYLSIPTRPPAVKEVKAPKEDTINLAYQIFSEKLSHVEYLIGYEGNAFAFTGNVIEDLLSITSVHPMRKDAMEAFLVRARADWTVVQRLIDQRHLMETHYNGQTFFMRKLTEKM